jgi:hypothetical protein
MDMADQKKGPDATNPGGGGGSENPRQQQQQQQQQPQQTHTPGPAQQQQQQGPPFGTSASNVPGGSGTTGGAGATAGASPAGRDEGPLGTSLKPAHVFVHPPPGRSGVDVNASVSIENVPSPDVTRDSAAALNAVILSCTESSRFEFYEEFIRDVFGCGPEPEPRREPLNDRADDPARETPRARRYADPYTAGMLQGAASNPLVLNYFSNRAAYELLKVATEAYLTLQCTEYDIDPYAPDQLHEFGNTVLGRKNTEAQIRKALGDQLGENRVLPYIDRIARALVLQAERDAAGRRRGNQNPKARDPKFSLCDFSPLGAFKPCCIELIWSYWHEEGMLVQTINAVSLRFQNKRSSAAGRDPLAHLELEPLRPLNNILWGYIQDEQNRLTVARRAYEYQHEYGLSLYGKAVPPLNPADVRSKFVEAFHNLLHTASIYFRDQSNRFVVPDSFPLLNAIKEVHLILAEGAHNQFGDLPWTARSEMLIQKWLLSRPEIERFLGGRFMIPYPEKWMGVVDQMKTLQGWTDVSVRHFRDLAQWGEQLLLSLRWNNWSEISSTLSAENWALIWRDAIQGYIHSYRAVTGVDLAASTNSVRLSPESYTQPSVLLRNRLAAQRRP